MILLVLAAALTMQGESCHAVLDGDQILGRHLSAADARLAGIAPDQAVGFAPVPGLKRVFSPAELIRLFPSGGPVGRITEPLCVEWPMREPSAELFAQAIQESLGTPGVQVEVLSFSAGKLPPGKIVFERSGISSEEMITTVGATWRGAVLIEGKARYSVWARVRIIYESERLVAAEDLPAGRPIKEGQVRLAMVRGLPGGGPLPKEPLTGMTLLRPIRAGRPIALTDLQPPVVIARGDEVEVTVQRGAVRFRASVQATTAGRPGEWIQVKNPESGKTFRALVDGPGKVYVP